MASYLVTLATDSLQTSVKMCLRDMRTATEILWGNGINPRTQPLPSPHPLSPLPMDVRGLKIYFILILVNLHQFLIQDR